MEKKVFGIISVLLVIVTFAITLFLMLFPSFHQYALSHSGESQDRSSVLSLVQEEEESDKHSIRLPLPEGVTLENVNQSRDDVRREITLNITGVENSFFYQHPISGSVDHIQDVYYDYAGGVGRIQFVMDSIYETELSLENHTLYMNFIDPRDLYDYIVVVDAGHGGNDVGCEGGGIYEKDLTLQIVEKMKEVFERANWSDVKVYNTR